MPALERLRHAGLAETIRAEARQAVDGHLACELDLSEYDAQPPETEEALYRAFQEALHNVVKHAHAAWAKIELKCAEGLVILRVTDNGEGLRPGGAGGEWRRIRTLEHARVRCGWGRASEAAVPSRSRS